MAEENWYRRNHQEELFVNALQRSQSNWWSWNLNFNFTTGSLQYILDTDLILEGCIIAMMFEGEIIRLLDSHLEETILRKISAKRLTIWSSGCKWRRLTVEIQRSLCRNFFFVHNSTFHFWFSINCWLSWFMTFLNIDFRIQWSFPCSQNKRWEEKGRHEQLTEFNHEEKHLCACCR